MKKLLSVVLIATLLLSLFTVTAFAENVESKIEPQLLETIEKSTDGGVMVEITHHDPQYPTSSVSQEEAVMNNVYATSKLISRIEKISYAEVSVFDIGKLCIGLPFSSIKDVAKIETVDYISIYKADIPCELTAEQKITKELSEKVKELNEDDEINIAITLSYSDLVYIGIPEKEFVTVEEAQEYVEAKRKIQKEYITKKNAEYFERISENAEISLNEVGKFSQMLFVTTTVKELNKIAQMDIVSGLLPIQPPTTILGDADGDGEVTIIDATCVQKFKAELIKEDEISMTKADIDKDGSVTIIDATLIQKTLASVE